MQTFNAPLESTGINMITPFESIALGAKLDIQRIRNGEPKYLLRDVFLNLFPNINIPDKIPFARSMYDWMKSWKIPERIEFFDDLNINYFSGEQKWLIYCLERFLNLLD